MKRRTSTIVIFCLVSSVHSAWPGAPRPSAETQTILLWENGAPGALGQSDDDKPTITVYRPWRPNLSGTAVIVAPGGGYGVLASNHEGRQVANWFNAMGVTAFVLKYRLGPRYHHPIELGDAQRAIRLVRSRAKEFDVSPDRIGMMGFSAGGHLASTAATHFDGGNPAAVDPIDRAGSRPDFVILGYPVITFGSRLTPMAGRPRTCWATIRIRSWFRNSPTNFTSPRRLRQHSCSPPAKTPWCPRRTA